MTAERHPTCRDCGAFLQAVRRGGVELPRCPWSRDPGDCGKPYKRTGAARPDLVLPR